ncbi:MAG: hypothetical protein ACODTU_04830 [Pigmentiphaga sp.]|uniref:hypothetical protein n=1 Tax=unclassified Pigmentiphaga TaxID=2626614 RepID=UPI000B407D03|nr:hypothetical protein [Pigmentiphaga sp. NML030171]OVZ64588.1 hypothetical protein CDO46_08360 [Pigmentiphaga sp. NML030171]
MKDPNRPSPAKPATVIRQRPADPNWLGVGSEDRPREEVEPQTGAEPADVGRKMPGEVPPAGKPPSPRGRDPDLA